MTKAPGQKKIISQTMVEISGFRRKADENCTLLGYYAIIKTMLV
jgi:hypothetical protein